MSITRDVIRVLVERLPSGWGFDERPSTLIGKTTRLRPDAVGTVRSPDGRSAVIVIEVERRVEPRMVSLVVEEIHRYCAAIDEAAVPVVGAEYLSLRTREALTSHGIGYVDTTGNVQLAISSPGLFIITAGAERDPWPAESRLASLRGRGAAVAVRALVDTQPPFGVRQLAETTGASAPTLSRVIGLLDSEGIVMRSPQGSVKQLDWRAALRRWAEDYGQLTSNRPTMVLDPRGLRSVESRLVNASFRHAATGAFAAQRFDPIAPARTATLYVDDPAEAAGELNLREVDSGANVLLLEPFDPVVFVGTLERDGLTCAAPSQLAVDLLTGPGREAVQGEELLTWMGDNESAWRT